MFSLATRFDTKAGDSNGGRVPGEQRFDVGQRCCLGQFGEQALQVIVGRETVGLCSLDQSVQARGCVCAARCVGDQSRFFHMANGRMAFSQRLLSPPPAAAVEHADQQGPFAREIVQRLAGE